MYIQHTAVANPESPVGTRSLIHSEYTDGERVSFNAESGKAQVTKTVGEQLVEHYDAIEPAESDGSSEDS